MRTPVRALRSLLLLASLAACSSNDVTSLVPSPTEGSLTVDASTSWRFVSLTDSALVLPTPSASESPAWDIAFNATNVTLNGGAAGPGGITAACICQNATATGDEVLAMTAASEQADFDAVTTVPAGLTWHSDALTPAISGWFTGTGAAAAADTARSWLVRLADSSSYALVRVRSIESPTAAHAGRVTLEYAVQATAASPLGPMQTIVVDLATPGTRRVDLSAGSLTTSATDWDLRLEGFSILVNGGVSGAGKGGAAANTAAFAATTTAVTQANAYRTDVYAGVFGVHRYYRYNIAGDHRISPNFDVYLLRRGTATYKLQVTSYYSATGTARQITFRWQRIDG